MLKTMARAGSLVGNRCRVREVAWLDGFCGSSAALPTLRGFVVHILSAFQLHRFAQQRSARCRPAACLVCAVQNDTQASRTWHRLRKEPEPASATGSRRNPPPHFFVKKDSKIPPRIVSFLPAYYSNSYPLWNTYRFKEKIQSRRKYIMGKLKVCNLSLEVTRRCNMNCEHCLRGDAQNMDADLALIPKIFAGIDELPGCLSRNPMMKWRWMRFMSPAPAPLSPTATCHTRT